MNYIKYIQSKYVSENSHKTHISLFLANYLYFSSVNSFLSMSIYINVQNKKYVSLELHFNIDKNVTE